MQQKEKLQKDLLKVKAGKCSLDEVLKTTNLQELEASRRQPKMERSQAKQSRRGRISPSWILTIYTKRIFICSKPEIKSSKED